MIDWVNAAIIPPVDNATAPLLLCMENGNYCTGFYYMGAFYTTAGVSIVRRLVSHYCYINKPVKHVQTEL